MALILDNITLREYLQLTEYEERFNYDFVLKHAKIFKQPIDVFDVGDFTELEFGLIKDLQHDLSDGITWVKLIEYIRKLTDKKEEELGKYKLLDLSQFASYIRKEIERINEIEMTLLTSPPDEDEKQAGINDFSKFGSYTQLRRLANGDLTKLEGIKKIKYSICLMELLYLKTDSEFKNALIRIRSRK